MEGLFSSGLILENDRVKLEPLTLQHLDELKPIALRHPDLLKYSPSVFGERIGEYVQNAVDERKAKLRYPFAIFEKLSSRWIGSTSYGNFSFENQRLEIGWTWIDPLFHGSGVNMACKILLLEYAFAHLGIERIEFRTDERNISARKSLEKLGAVFEGVMRSHTVLIDGFRRNTAIYSVLRSEWKTPAPFE